MIASLNIVNEFFEDPIFVRRYALGQDFSQAPEYDGHKYPGFAPVKDERFLRHIEGVFLRNSGMKVSVKMAHFAAGTADHRTVQWIHADNSCATFAGVIYLFGEPGFGTAFWRHRALKADGLMEAKSVMEADGSSPEDIAARLHEDGKSAEAWEETDYADSKFNRLIFYPTDRFHSRWPENGFGDKPESCRLTLALFFDFA